MSERTERVEFLVVGSGPTGVAAAIPLVDAGADVCLIDAGAGLENGRRQTLPQASYLDSRRRQADQWRWILGPGHEALLPAATSSPKLRTPTHRDAVVTDLPGVPVIRENFTTLFSMATGGMSTAWGAGVSCYSDEDLDGCPVTVADLADSFQKLAEDIGISGLHDDLADFHGSDISLQSPAVLGPPAQHVLERYRASGARNGFALGHARNAVLTETSPDPERSPCAQLALCLWGCPHHSIYSSVYTLRVLRSRGLRYRSGHRVDRLRRVAGGLVAQGRRAGAPGEFRIEAKRVILACGPPISARLVLESLGCFDTPIPFETAPAIGFATLVPALLGRVPQSAAFGLSQLSFVQRLSEHSGDYAYGNLFGTDGILHTDIAPYLPLRLTAARRILRPLLPAMLLGNCFLPGLYSRHTLQVSRNGGLEIHGRFSEDLRRTVRKLKRRLRRRLGRSGAHLLPGGFQLTRPGDDIHLGAILPMKASPEPWECTADGEVAGLRGVHVADAASLPRIPARPHTFTAMANAHRIGKRLAGG